MVRRGRSMVYVISVKAELRSVGNFTTLSSISVTQPPLTSESYSRGEFRHLYMESRSLQGLSLLIKQPFLAITLENSAIFVLN